jgi:hypothetical protein
MTQADIKNIFQIDDIVDLPSVVSNILFDITEVERNKVYKKLLEGNNYNIETNWFQEMYESELAERKQKKQDFTPLSVATITSLLTNKINGTVHEPTAGIGTMLIADWYRKTQNYLPFEYFPSEHIIDCWELSHRAIPLLLLNLSIRGIMGYVWHGDVLTRNVFQKYILINHTDDALGFSSVYKVGIKDIIVKNTNS